MTMLAPGGRAADQPDGSNSPGGLVQAMKGFSLITMLLTVPQVYNVWFGQSASGVSAISWAAYLVSACLWLVYGIRKNDRTIYVPCLGWIALDAAIVVGVLVNG